MFKLESYFSEYAEIVPGTLLLPVASIFLIWGLVSIAHCVIVHTLMKGRYLTDGDKQYNTCPVLFDSDVEFQESKTLSSKNLDNDLTILVTDEVKKFHVAVYSYM